MTTRRFARSSNWRVSSSAIRAVEGAYILRSLKKVAGAVGLPAGYRVRFVTGAAKSGLNADNADVVLIGAGDVFTKAPIPPENLDILVGRTLHEVEHHTINTIGVWFSCLYKVPQAERELFQQFVHIGEDIIIDFKLTNNQHLKDYYEAAMERIWRARRRPHLNNLLELWIEYTLARNPDIILRVPKELTPAMNELVALTNKLRVYMDRFSGTRVRAEYYISAWNIVKEVVLHPPELPEDADGSGGETPSEDGNPEDIRGPTRSGPTDETGEDDDTSSQLNSDPAPIDDSLAEAIEEAMISDTEDITDRIYDQFQDAGFEPSRRGFLITRKRETKTIAVKPDGELSRRLERILTIRKRLQARVMRGEYYGKLDMRKLHRSQTDRRIFKLKYQFPDGFPEAAILVDMSGSMTGEQAEEVIIAATSLANVVKCQVWSYAQCSSEIAITRLNEGNITHGARPEGNTPSGIALVAVADTMRRGSLIIHLTDGEHNVDFGPIEATRILDKKSISAVHLLWGEHEGPYAGLKHKTLSAGLAEFPEALYRILIEQLKLESLAKK